MVFDMKSANDKKNADDEGLEAYNLSAPEGSTRNVAIVLWLIEASLKLSQVLPGDLGAREGRQHPSAGGPPNIGCELRSPRPSKFGSDLCQNSGAWACFSSAVRTNLAVFIPTGCNWAKLVISGRGSDKSALFPIPCPSIFRISQDQPPALYSGVLAPAILSEPSFKSRVYGLQAERR